MPLPVLTLAFYTRDAHGLGDFVFDGRHDISAASVLVSLIGELMVGVMVGGLMVGGLFVGGLFVGGLFVGWLTGLGLLLQRRLSSGGLSVAWTEFRHVLDLRLD